MNMDRKIIPLQTGDINFSLPEISEFKAANSLNIIYVHKDNLPIIRFSYMNGTGSRIDPGNQKGLANLMGMVLDEGAGGLNAIELKEEFQLLGTNFYISTNKDLTSLSFLSLKENFGKSLELLNLILNEPEFGKQSFDREKGKILTSLQQVKDSADLIADLTFNSLIFNRNEPYAFPTAGYTEDINNLSVDSLVSYYKNIFIKSEPYIIVAGDIGKEELGGIVEDKLFSQNSYTKAKELKGELEERKTKIYLVDKKDSLQSEIRIGHLTSKRNEKDFYSKALLNTILGGQFTSRLNLNLREAKGYTYGVHSSFSYYKYAGSFFITTSVATEFTGPAIIEIISEINKIHQGVTEDELNFARSSVIKRFPSNFETYGQITSNLSAKIKHSLPDNYFDNYLNKISSVTLEAIKEAAIKNIHPENAVVLVVGDKEKIMSQLKDLELGDVFEVGIFGADITNN